VGEEGASSGRWRAGVRPRRKCGTCGTGTKRYLSPERHAGPSPPRVKSVIALLRRRGCERGFCGSDNPPNELAGEPGSWSYYASQYRMQVALAHAMTSDECTASCGFGSVGPLNRKHLSSTPAHPCCRGTRVDQVRRRRPWRLQTGTKPEGGPTRQEHLALRCALRRSHRLWRS
jgi:hypothetical protein